MTPIDPVASLESGAAYADLSDWRKLEVTGDDAGRWLQDLVSADIEALLPGRARRSLLLSPTGRIRAAFTVALTAGGWLLLQDPAQPRSVGQLLAPYVLSSGVVIEDRTDQLALFAFPGGTLDGPTEGWSSVPSCLGSGGQDLIVPTSGLDRARSALSVSFMEVAPEAVERWRIRAGLPRFGIDALEDDLPQEGGFDDAVAFDKGCYLGQEAVAKVRNLGHPRRLVLSLRSTDRLVAGAVVLSVGTDVGVVTSAAADGEGSRVLARVKWEAKEAPLQTASGASLERDTPVPQPSSPV
jgi:folate-binding protein YgfZ